MEQNSRHPELKYPTFTLPEGLIGFVGAVGDDNRNGDAVGDVNCNGDGDGDAIGGYAGYSDAGKP